MSTENNYTRKDLLTVGAGVALVFTVVGMLIQAKFQTFNNLK